MLVLLVTDIYGVGPHIDGLLQEVLPPQVNAMVIDPYGAQFMHFEDEQSAYDTFQEFGGLVQYQQNLALALDELQPDIAIGFSAGADALWQCAVHPPQSLKQLVLYYPGQLHRLLTHVPSINTTLTLVNNEHHYKGDEIAAQLADFAQIQVSVRAQKHGFLNPMSEAYNDAAYEAEIAALKGRLGH